MAVIVTRDIETPLGKMRVGACEGALVFALWLTGEPEREPSGRVVGKPRPERWC